MATKKDEFEAEAPAGPVVAEEVPAAPEPEPAPEVSAAPNLSSDPDKNVSQPITLDHGEPDAARKAQLAAEEADRNDPLLGVPAQMRTVDPANMPE